MWKRKLKPDGTAVNGFTLLESLCALLCALVVFSLCMAIMQFTAGFMKTTSYGIREMGILQLRELAAGFDVFQVEEGVLRMENARDLVTLEFHNNRIVRRPGYEIFLEGVEDGEFYEEDGIWLYVRQNSKSWHWQIVPDIDRP